MSANSVRYTALDKVYPCCGSPESGYFPQPVLSSSPLQQQQLHQVQRWLLEQWKQRQTPTSTEDHAEPCIDAVRPDQDQEKADIDAQTSAQDKADMNQDSLTFLIRVPVNLIDTASGDADDGALVLDTALSAASLSLHKTSPVAGESRRSAVKYLPLSTLSRLSVAVREKVNQELTQKLRQYFQGEHPLWYRPPKKDAYFTALKSMLAVWCCSALVVGVGVGIVYGIYAVNAGETTFLEKHQASVLSCCGGCAVGTGVTFGLSSQILRKGDAEFWRSISVSILPALLFLILIVYFQSYPDSTLSSLTLCGLLITLHFVTTVHFNFVSIWSHRAQLLVKAQRQAQLQLLLVEEGNGDSNETTNEESNDKENKDNKENKDKRNKTHKMKKYLQRYSFRATVRKALLGGLPIIFVIAIGFLYVFVFFELYNATTSLVLKAGLATLALSVKIVGNKIQLMIFQSLWKHAPLWLMDTAAFLYEVSTALLCRILIMSIPDTRAAETMSLLESVAEVMTRIWFTNRYLSEGAWRGREQLWKMEETVTTESKTSANYSERKPTNKSGGKNLAKISPLPVESQFKTQSNKKANIENKESKANIESKESKEEYFFRGIIRVLDANNDMTVEYITSFLAAAMLYWLPDTGVFRLTVEKSVPLSVLIPLVILQTVPELVVDIYANCFECTSGMLRLHQYYWTKFSWLNILMKLGATIVTLAFCLSACIISNPI